MKPSYPSLIKEGRATERRRRYGGMGNLPFEAGRPQPKTYKWDYVFGGRPNTHRAR